MTALRKGPQYPARLHAHPTAAGRPGCRRGAARISGRRSLNGTSTNKLSLSIATFNARTIARETDLAAIKEQKSHIACDILGLCETRWQKVLYAEWKDGLTVDLGVGEDPRNVGGIGFIVSKEWSKSIGLLDVSRPRIGVLMINLQKQQTLRIIQVYAPTSAADNKEIERFYDDLKEEINKRSTYLVIMGDFNAKVGRRQDNETFIGPFGGDRNERGERLTAMAESRRLFVANTFFQKRAGQRWTWISPNGETKNKIDYILTNQLQIVQDVTVIGRAFSTSSNNQLIHARIVLDAKVENKALAISNAGQKKMTFDAKVFLQHVDASNWTLSEDLNDDCNKFVNQLKHCRQQSEVSCDNHQQKRISSSTRKLLDQRCQMKRITANNVKYHFLCKLIQRQLKEDHDTFRRQALLDTAEKHRSLRKCRRNLIQPPDGRIQLQKNLVNSGDE
uniref:Endonuclease/exonuclease/phosphatase domain-containing protein n=1 Tax=Plectus sambesii TaxID=2011161 RepID=A0A914VF67_9BILA